MDSISNKKGDLIVAVWMVTYNHELYIEQAIESVMMQVTDFEFKLFIGEDCSTDKTREICINLKEKYGHKIELILHEHNIGPSKNAESVYKTCFDSGAKYLALLEGDDYWIDSFKLQEQVRFLENNDQFGAIFTNAAILNTMINEEKLYNNFLKTGEVSNEVIFKYGGGLYPTASFVFKNDFFELIDFSIPFIAGDESILFQLANKTKIFYFDKVTVAYRRWEGGLYSSISENTLQLIKLRKKEILAYCIMLNVLNERNQILLKKNIKSKAFFITRNSTSLIDKIYYYRFIGIKAFLRRYLTNDRK